MSTLTKSEVASLVGKSERTIDRWMRLGRLTPIKRGKRIVFSAAEVAALQRGGSR